MMEVIVFACIIAGIGALECSSKKQQQAPVPVLLNYEYVGSNFVLPVVQKLARGEYQDIEYPNTVFDIRCVERLNVTRNQLVFTVSMNPRATVTNETLGKLVRNELTTRLSRALQVDYAELHKALHVVVRDVQGTTMRHVCLEFSDSLIIAVTRYMHSSLCE